MVGETNPVHGETYTHFWWMDDSLEVAKQSYAFTQPATIND
jgi:hypothetical protein